MSKTCPKRSGRLFAALAGALISFCALPVQAQDMARIWQDLARLDSEAALRLIEVNHPGARPELADAEFLARIDTARRHVAERLPLVRDHSGYSAVLAGLANDFGDGHIWSSAQLSPNRITWAGLVTEWRGGRWFASADFNEGGDLTDAELLSCDGRPAEEIGRERIGLFRANADVEADLAGQAYTLLLDDGNPFLQPLTSCRFRLASGEETERALSWRAAARNSVVAKNAVIH